MAARRSLCAAAAGLALAAAGAGESRASSGAPWAAWTASPVAADTTTLDELERAAMERCGPSDRGLLATARLLLAVKLAGRPMPELDGIAFAQRVSGEPHPWARAWALTAPAPSPETVRTAIDAWLGDRAGAARRSFRRCGVAGARATSGVRVLVAVAVEALADLEPLPTRARTGQWLTVEAALRVPAAGASVVVLGPHGPPRTVPTSLEGGRARARFVLDSPGEFAVQVIADLAGGPRPVIEASVFADVDPPGVLGEAAAPGEVDAEGGAASLVADGGRVDGPSAVAEDALWRMLQTARRSQGVDAVIRDPRLDAVARAHAIAMAAARDLAHDVGDGDPLERMRAAGLAPSAAGENVAHAATTALAHRATWASPAHRANLLRRELTSAGVGVVRDSRGEIWIAEELAGGSL